VVDKIVIENLSLQYADGTESLRNVSMGIPANEITVLFGPAGGGKSTLLRCLNRLNDLTEIRASKGKILMDGENILDPKTDVIALRRKVGMVFARPVVLPMSIRGNLTYGLELAGETRRSRLDEAVERSLRLAAIWDEVKDRLDEPAIALSGGQQQRLCLARVLALQPEVILLDEPTSGLDPISTGKVEAALQELKKDYTIILVPHRRPRRVLFARRTGGVPIWAGNFHQSQRQADGGLCHREVWVKRHFRVYNYSANI
jgi:phosphate transport system ATP-binding protein